MNKDKRNLTETERKMLILSEEQLYCEVESRLQLTFRPDPEFHGDLEKYSWLLKCCLCKQIPLDIRQCINCEATICEACRIKLI